MTDTRRPKLSDPTAERSSDPVPDGKDITGKKENEDEGRPGRDEAPVEAEPVGGLEDR
jgi:hypothetical protein